MIPLLGWITLVTRGDARLPNHIALTGQRTIFLWHLSPWRVLATPGLTQPAKTSPKPADRRGLEFEVDDEPQAVSHWVTVADWGVVRACNGP
jgi:hypothetical protein